MNRIGIMQGRLSRPLGQAIQTFPVGTWAAEFGLAQQAGLASIEWIYDLAGESDNPLCSDDGLAGIRREIDRTGVAVHSLCADWFMDFPLLRCAPAERAERVERFRWLLGRCQTLGVQRVVLPFVDASAIRDELERGQVAGFCREVLPLLERHHLELHLETALGPADFAALLAQVVHPLVGVNYDSGNSASLGHDPQAEFAAYGDRIGSIHIKDRKRGAGTVPLGTGDTDFPSVFSWIKARNFPHPLIMQVARGEAGRELEHAQANRAWILARV
jgi:L-ribulose-5-phosphate 3-epimerase